MASEQPLSEPKVAEASPLPREVKSLGLLARRITAWTSNSLITLMLLVIGIGFGRQVLHAWRDGSASPKGMPRDSLGDPAVPHVMEFGDQAWSIRRQQFSGSRDRLATALRDACQAALPFARPASAAADQAEEDLLRRLAREQPMAEEKGRWRLYAWGAGHLVLIGTRAVSDEAATGTASSPWETLGPKSIPSAPRTVLAETTYRVVIWGVAISAGQNAWTLFLFQPGGSSGTRPGAQEIPLPPGGRRQASIRAEGGGAISAFSADDGLAVREFYDRWFGEHGWEASRAWRQVASGWDAEFEQRSGSPARTADIRLGCDPQGGWTGLIVESQEEKGKP